MRNCFCSKKTAERDRIQIDSLGIQMYASFLTQNGGLQVSEEGHRISIR